jgi:hypothetical protein
MARGSRKPRPGDGETMRRGYARAEQRNAELRAQLTPLVPGERPGALVAASAVAGVLAVANLAAFAAGVEVDGRRPNAAAVGLFELLALVATIGLWQRRYWAVLGFEALLGIIVVFFSLFLLRASNVLAVVVCVPIICGAAWLFWKLVRVMGRLQAPQRVR